MRIFAIHTSGGRTRFPMHNRKVIDPVTGSRLSATCSSDRLPVSVASIVSFFQFLFTQSLHFVNNKLKNRCVYLHKFQRNRAVTVLAWSGSEFTLIFYMTLFTISWDHLVTADIRTFHRLVITYMHMVLHTNKIMSSCKLTGEFL